MNKQAYLQSIADLLDEYSGQEFEQDENGEIYEVECEITFIRDDGLAERWTYTGGEFEQLEDHN